MITGELSCAFDMLNVRDIDLVHQARRLCDELVVGVYSDDVIEQRTGRPPIVPLDERLALMGHVRGVARVHAVNDVPAGGIDDAVLRLLDDGHEVRPAVLLRSQRETKSTVLHEALRRAHPAAAAVA